LQAPIDFAFWRLQERYDTAEIGRAVEVGLPAALEAFELLPMHLQQHELIRSRRSVFWNGHEDLTSLRPNEKQARIVEARLFEKVFAEVAFGPEFVGNYYDGENRMMLCFSWGLSTDNYRGFLSLQTAHGSGVDFWIGRGVLVNSNGRLRHTIVSRIQYEQMQSHVRSVDLSDEDLPPGPNFEQVDSVTDADSGEREFSS